MTDRLDAPALRKGVAVTEFYDDFERAAEQLSASADWTFVSGTEGACATDGSGGLNTTDTNSSGTVYYSPDLGSDAQFVEGVLATTGAVGPFLCCRFLDGNNFIGVRDAGPAQNQWQVYSRTAGTFGLIGTYAAQPVPDDVFRLEVEDLAVRFILNGVTRIDTTMTEGVAGLGRTRQGIYSRIVNKSPWLKSYRAGRL